MVDSCDYLETLLAQVNSDVLVLENSDARENEDIQGELAKAKVCEFILF
jgi:hypothetical protein